MEVGLYRRAAAYSVPWSEKARLFAWLLRADLPPVVHFFFSPNPATAVALGLWRRLRRGPRVVQTVMSLPENSADLQAGVFADVVVTWSQAASGEVEKALKRRRDAVRVVHIRPGIEPLAPASAAEKADLKASFGLRPDRPLILYAGDLEFGSGAGVVAACVEPVLARTDAVFVFACRPKTPAARLVFADLRRRLQRFVARGDVRLEGALPRFHELVRCADVQVLPSETTYAKTDIPLVLLEGLSAQVPAVVALGTPMAELVDEGAAIGVPAMEPEALISTLLGLLASPDRAAALGRSGRAYVLARHTAHAMAEAHADLYRDLLRVV